MLSLPESLQLLLPDGTVRRILLEDYLRGVVAAALSADAPLDAMQALAIAARTFAANTHRHADRSADVCTTRHCQAWSERANPRAARAVMETRGIVATFNDQLIEAFYFEHCDGKTRDAKGVLLNAPAYLKSVSCPCGFASIKGHGIGMCLRGMLALAHAGANYESILTHFYSGIALQQLAIDESTRVTEPLARPRKPMPAKSKPLVKPTPRVVSPKSKTSPATAPSETEKPDRKSVTPRRSPRPKIEYKEKSPEAVPPPKEETSAPVAPPDARLLTDAHSPEEDDLLLFLAVEDVAAPAEKPKPAPVVPAASPPPAALPRFDPTPPPSTPEEFPDAPELEMFAPPASMPEDLPRAGELDFLVPPTHLPEDLLGAPPDELLNVAPTIEPNLGEFIPPVEKFYTPLDAPPTFPENIPSFTTLSADKTPIAWAPPPPMQETEAIKQPRVLMDSLPGPRIIAGNLPNAGMLVTIRDARGNSIVTVSGVAKQYGSGGFEAPLTDDGAYHVKFDGTELDVSLQNETVFIYYQ